VRGHLVGFGGFDYKPSGRLLLVGDAAGFVDALLGEGIYNAIRSGQAAAAAIRDELEHGLAAAAGYARRLAEIQNDVAACYRAAVTFYNNLDVGYAVLMSPVIRRAAMKGYAVGLTFSETRKWFLLLPLVPVRAARALKVRGATADL
jgi:flavin-dependent dehydrogenase